MQKKKRRYLITTWWFLITTLFCLHRQIWTLRLVCICTNGCSFWLLPCLFGLRRRATVFCGSLILRRFVVPCTTIESPVWSSNFWRFSFLAKCRRTQLWFCRLHCQTPGLRLKCWTRSCCGLAQQLILRSVLLRCYCNLGRRSRWGRFARIVFSDWHPTRFF